MKKIREMIFTLFGRLALSPARGAVILAFVFLAVSPAGPAGANNLAIENVSLADKDTGGNTVDIEFDIAWDNSWYDSGAPSLTANWDAAWVFAKFSVRSGGAWSDWAHCTLLNTGSSAPSGSQFSFGQTGSDYVGAFLYRSSSGTGSVNWDNAQVRWDYGADGVGDSDLVRVRVLGIEMVYIPEGAFEVGDTDCDQDGNIMLNSGCGAGSVTISTTITSALCTEANSYDQTIECSGGDSTGTFCIDGDGGFDLGCNGIENASFPTGYGAFYMMKHEATQGQYRDFLNLLTRDQQNTRAESRTANYYAMSATSSLAYRSGIRNPAIIPGGAVTFGCDLDTDGTFDESNDGEGVAANYVSWMDNAAYCDWSGLRPMTELEFVKAARGGQSAVDDEQAWGSTTVESATTSLSDSGTAAEAPDQGNLNYSSSSPDGPYRAGSFADGSSTRANAGAGYYGVMELSGSLYERPVTIGNSTGRGFTGTHGDGALSSNGNADNSDWPGYVTSEVTDATGSGIVGGCWDYFTSSSPVANRNSAAYTYTNRDSYFGVRCVRTSP